MARKRRRQHLVAGELNLVAMIDVAFQILSFFIMTARPQDVLTNLNVFRPSQEKENVQETVLPNMIRIMIYQNAFTLNENPITFKNMEVTMTRLAAHDTSQTILIMCRAESRHKHLIDVLDMCAKLKLTNLSVISSN
jgi:biopolymer transport protein ExbD